MKQKQSALWHRCGTCGTIFISMQELTVHLTTHKGARMPYRRRAPANTGKTWLARKKTPALSDHQI